MSCEAKSVTIIGLVRMGHSFKEVVRILGFKTGYNVANSVLVAQ